MAVKITQALIKEFFDYNPETGLIRIKPRDRKWFISDGSHLSFNSRYGWKPLKTKDKDGYMFMTVLGTRCLAHRIAYIFMTGVWPDEIDHVNGIRDDNSWDNLRLVTRRENLRNGSVTDRTPYKVLGISFIPETGKWRARISADGCSTKHLGVFADWFDAVCSKKAAEYKYGYHENHGKSLQELQQCP